MEGMLASISRLFSEKDPIISIKALKNITKNLENNVNISFPSNLTLCLLSKFSQAITNVEYPNYKLICKDFLYFFTLYLKNCPFDTYKDYLISLLSQGLRLSDHLIKVRPLPLVDITLLVDYFRAIFRGFRGKLTFVPAVNGDVSLEESLIGATVHFILEFIDDGIKSPNCFGILTDISESVSKTTAENYYPGICCRLGRFIIKSSNDLTKVYALESLGLWIAKVMDSSTYRVSLRDKIDSIDNLTGYPVEYEVIVKDNPHFAELVTNTNSILELILKIKSDNPKVTNAFIQFYGNILKKCTHFISNKVHSDIIAYLLANCKDYNNAAKILQSNNRNMIVVRDVVGKCMANDDFIASIDLFQGYNHLSNDGIIPLDSFLVFKWLLKLSKQQYIQSFTNSTSIDRFFKYGIGVSTVIKSYYKYHLTKSQKHEVLESLSESLHLNVVGEGKKQTLSKWISNLSEFRSDSPYLDLQHSILIPFIANIGFLIESLENSNLLESNYRDNNNSLESIVTSFRVILRHLSLKQYLDNEDKLLLCNIYYTMSNCNRHGYQLIDYGIHSIVFDTINLICLNNEISSYALEFMTGVYGDMASLLSKYANHLINSCRSIIRSFEVNKLLMAKNVIGFICKSGLEGANTGLSQFALDVMNTPIHIRQSNETSLIKPIIIDYNITEFDEEFVITLVNSVLLSFQREISRSRESKRAIGNDLLSRNINDCIRNDDVAEIPQDVLHPIMPIDSLGKFGLYRRVATSVVARARHAMLLSQSRYNLACKASSCVLLGLYILSTNVSELLPRISEIFPMALSNINSSIVLSAYAIVILKYCNLLAPEFVKHKQSDIVTQIYQRLLNLELANDADERHLSSSFIFQSFALEYLVIITESKQFCLEIIFRISIYFSRAGIASKLKELTRNLWINLKEVYPNHALLILRALLDLANGDALLGQILGDCEKVKLDNLDLNMLSQVESVDPMPSLKIPSRFKLKQIPCGKLVDS